MCTSKNDRRPLRWLEARSLWSASYGASGICHRLEKEKKDLVTETSSLGSISRQTDGSAVFTSYCISLLRNANYGYSHQT
jgi:hypothetical protein